MNQIIIHRTDGREPVVIYVSDDMLDYELQLLDHDTDVASYEVYCL